MKNNPSFYAVIPATVRYDKSLSNGARLLYAEISSLCNEKGYCWATNRHFAELFNVEARTIQRLITQLEEAGYIKIFLQLKETNHSVKERRIYLHDAIVTPKQKKEERLVEKSERDEYKISRLAGDKNVTRPRDKNVTPIIDNNKEINNKESEESGEGPPEADRLADAKPVSSRRKAKEDLLLSQAKILFDDWKKVWNHPNAVFDDKRKRKLIWALNLKDDDGNTYGLEKLLKVPRGAKLTPWNNGTHPQALGIIRDNIDLLFRDSDHIERFIREADKHDAQAAKATAPPECRTCKTSKEGLRPCPVHEPEKYGAPLQGVKNNERKENISN